MTAGTAWTADELRRFGDTVELRLASLRADGTLRPYVIMWVVRVGDELYVRSAYGPDNPWYRRATAQGAGRIRAGSLEADVTFAAVDPGDDIHAVIDATYHAKYDAFGQRIVGTVVGPAAHQVTLRLDSRPSRDRT